MSLPAVLLMLALLFYAVVAYGRLRTPHTMPWWKIWSRKSLGSEILDIVVELSIMVMIFVVALNA